MDFKISNYCLPILILVCVIEANNSSTNGDTRRARGSGRVVKLYSGVRPDPIVCTNEGFKGDPKDCAVFYRCMKSGRGKYTAFKFQCPPGTVYDPDTEVCNHPRNTKRSECGGLKEVATSRYEVNEIEEIQELPSPITSKAPSYTTLTTVKLALSQKPTSNKWQVTTTTIHPTLTTTKYQELMSYPGVSAKQHHLSSFTNEQQNTHENICTFDGFMGDSVNCQKFYRCVGNQHSGFTKYEFACSEPTIWDDDIKSCNHPWAVKRSRCGRSNSLSELDASTEASTVSSIITDDTTKTKSVASNANKTIQSQLQIAYGDKVHQTQTQISNNAAKQNQTQIHYGDRVNNTGSTSNKQNQTQISYGSAVSQSQYQLGYGNEVVQTQVQIDHSKQTSQSQVQIVESTTIPTALNHSHVTTHVINLQHNEDNTCLQSGFIGDSNDCKKFYRCVDNGRGGFTRHEFSCGEGTSWDQSIEACNHAWAVKECRGKPSTVVSKETTSKAPVSSTTQNYFITSKPTEDFLSSTEVTHPDDFDNVGYNNNHATSSSVGFTESTAEMHHTDTACKSSGFVGDAVNCQVFYSCVENGNGGYTKYEFKCGEGTLWDSDIGGCNHASAVKKCGGNSISTTTEISFTSKLTTTAHTSSPVTQMTKQNDDYDTGYGIHNDQSSLLPTVKTTAIPQDNLVESTIDCQSSGFIGDKNDCKKFYRCVNNGDGSYTRHEFKCGEGSAWDSQIENCNHVWAVDNCKNSSTSTVIEVTTQKKPIYVEISIGTPENKDSDISTQKTTLSTTSPKTTHSAEENKCTSSGFMGDTTDCKKFYRCVNNGDGTFVRYEFTCGEGTVWDPKIEACNHAWAVEKCGAYYDIDHAEVTTSVYNVTMNEGESQPDHGYPAPVYPVQSDEVTHKTTHSTTGITTSGLPSAHCKQDGFIGDESDCKRFYRCVNNGRGGFIKYEFQCGEGTVWDQSLEACNYASAVKDCGSRNITTPSTHESTTVMMLISPSEYSTEKTSSTTDINYENEISDECKREGFASDTKDCRHFYRCVPNGQGGFIKYEFKCGEGTYWNQIIQSCDHASPEHSCKENGNDIVTKEPQHAQDETHIETTTKITTLLTTITQESTSFTEKPQSSSTICKFEGFFGNKYDCRHFYRCVDDGKGGYNKYDFTCGDGTIWDQKLLTCAHKSDSNDCLSSSTGSSNQPQESSQENEGDNSFISSTTHMSHQTITEIIHVSHQTSTETTSSVYQCNTEGFHANPTDCRKFIRCVDDGQGTFTRYDFTCGDGTIWVQEILACDHDDGTATCHSQNESTYNTQTPFETSTSSSPTHSSTTSQNENSTKNDDDYTTEMTKGPQVLNDDCQSEGFYADKNDCKKYYRCVPNSNNGYTKYDFVCSEGTAWDTNLLTCNHNSAVNNCYGSSHTENQTESVVHDEISQTTKSTSTTSTTSTTQASTTESKESASVAHSDTCEKEGYFGNTNDCTKFYRCVDNGNGGLTKYDFTCGEGTIWDQDLLTCNYPHDVVHPSCKQTNGETSGNTDSSSGTTTTSTSKTTQSSETSSTLSSTTTTQSSQSSTSTTESSSSSPNCTQDKPLDNSGNKNVTCTKAGFFADPSDCKKFYRCVDWDGNGERFSVYFFECGEGTIWDPALDTCNHEASVYPPRDCSNSQQENTSSGQESTTTEQSTTPESTTSEKPTETTTSESTTQQSTTSEQITTQQSTTSEKTTTAQSTTSEQTTTQQSTSNETTTTEVSTTTSDGSTTQQIQNITETTTEQETTTEGVKESTTTEKTTTQESTTVAGTTTEESSTTAGITEQPTTSEQTTTDSEISTTEQTTTSTATESTQSTSTTENQQESTTENSSSTSSCPETDDDQYLFVCPTSFRRHPKYCNIFYQCTEDEDTHEVKVAVFNCPNNTIYDESKIQCVEEDKADKKCDGEIAARRRVKRLGANYKEPIVVTKDTQKCTTVGHAPFEKNSECSPVFLKCEMTKSGALRGYVHRCPQNYVYWSISRRCEREEVIRDCKRTINNWTGRWEIPIDRQNVAW